MSQTRIYVVEHMSAKRLVEAISSAQAIRHCVKDQYSAHVAGTKELAQLMRDGGEVEIASEQEGENENEL